MRWHHRADRLRIQQPFVSSFSATPGATPASERPGFKPGLLWLQAPELEDLAHTVWAWWRRYPPALLEEEAVLVPSNGMAEWFKAESARALGILSACRVELPARFAWRLYRLVLGAQANEARCTDKDVLPWYLASRASQWSALPELQATWQSILQRHAQASASAGPVHPGSLELYRWCVHAADLFDQYQWYRPDWLRDWGQGHAQLRLQAHDARRAAALPQDQAWQAALWRWLVHHERQRDGLSVLPSRVAVHQACIQRLRQASAGSLPQLPARVVLFGSTALPPVVLELLEALSRHALVVMAVPSPCQVHWTDLGDAPHEGHPLLAAWGKQSRDFIKQVEALEGRWAQGDERSITRVDPAPAGLSHSALARVQASIQSNEPLTEVTDSVRKQGQQLDDGSIRFVRAHTALREVEILHDHLLHVLTASPGTDRPQARDVVVMVPDLRTHAAAIRAVFGAYKEHDPRHIPWSLADLHVQADQGLPALADWLLSLPTRRCTAAELTSLLDSPAVCRRWGWDEDDRQALGNWVAASGIRWGLNHVHRRSLGLGAAGPAMTWQFGVDRMLAGYAAGAENPVAGAPLPGVCGLAARAAGQLAGLLRRLEVWRLWSSEPHVPSDWVEAFRALWADLLEPVDAEQKRNSQSIDLALSEWLGHTQQAGYQLPLSLDLVHLAVMEQLAQPGAQGRFRSSGVTFCTLMPLRAVPFRLVCLLGMDEGEYPRPIRARQGDLLAQPHLARPGDRSRRMEDRQLMLDALLSARQQLVVSWVGQQPTDQQHRPPSVLVGQLRDALTTIWGQPAVQAITADHPQQPFNPAYFTQGRLPATHTHEWQPHLTPRQAQEDSADHSPTASTATIGEKSGDPQQVLRWLKCPVTAFWQERLSTRWLPNPSRINEDEPMALSGLQAWSAWQAALGDLDLGNAACADPSWAQRCWARLQNKGLVPLAAPGGLAQLQLMGRIQTLSERLPVLAADGKRHRLLWSGSTFASGNPFKQDPTAWRVDLLIQAWWVQTVQAAQGSPFELHLLAPDAWVCAPPPDAQQAVQDLEQVLETIRQWAPQQGPQPATSRLVAALHWGASDQEQAWSRESARNPAWCRSFGRAVQGAEPRMRQAILEQWAQATQVLYGPFWRWCSSKLTVSAVAPTPLHWPVQNATQGADTP